MQFSAIGKWWNRSEEIDLVALDEEESTAWFGECKWSVNKVGIDIFRSLKESATQVEWRKQNRRDKYILFSRSGFTDEMQKLASADGVMLVHGDKMGGMIEKDNDECVISSFIFLLTLDESTSTFSGVEQNEIQQ